MAVYRLHKKEWEKGSRPLPTALKSTSAPAPTKTSTKRKEMEDSDDLDSDSDSEDESTSALKPALSPQAKSKSKPKTTPTDFPGGGRKGVSSGLSTIVRTKPGKSWPSGDAGGRSGSAVVATSNKTEWWKQLPGALPAGGGSSKGSIRVTVRSSS